MSNSVLITFSIVSHGQASLIKLLLNDFENLSERNFEVLITINLPEDESNFQGYSFPLRIIRNDLPKGFGNNHNFAFSQCASKWFVVLNPDIRLKILNFESLLLPFDDPKVGAVAPLVISAEGKVEDNARRFPTLMRFVRRVLLGQRAPDYVVQPTPYFVDWVAGMFVVFRRSSYHEIGGFDSRRFFMYLEDADICRRLRLSGWEVMVNPNSCVIHDAQRASHRSLQHMRWHIVSALRYLTGI